MLFILICLLFNVDGIPVAKMHNSSKLVGVPVAKMHNSSKLVGVPVAKMQNSDIISLILTSKDDNKALLNVLADADPAKLVEVIGLLQVLLSTSQNELAALVAASGGADSAYDDAVTVYNAAVVAQTTGTVQLQTDYDQGVAALQNAVNAAQAVVDSTTTAKNTANGVLSADRVRLDSEIATLTQVIALLQGVLGINTFSPTASPTNAPVSGTCNWLDIIGNPTGYNTVAGLHGVSQGSANGIVDGRSYPGWSNCVHTSDWRTDPYVYVDLEGTYDISKVTVEMGPAYTLGWSRGAKIMVANAPFNSISDFADAHTCKDLGGESLEYVGANGVAEIECDAPVRGRYLAYLVPGSSKIAMICEISVCGAAV